MNKPKCLDLFCGAGGASMGLYRAGFDVTGVDIKPQPHYPFKFIQADALTVSLDEYDCFWASPPCQYYTRLRHLPWLKGREYWRSVPPTLARLSLVWGKPIAIENVADCWDMPDSFILCGASLGLQLYRHRRILTNFPVFQPSHLKHTSVIYPGRASLSKRHHGQSGFKEISRRSVACHASYVGDTDRRRAVTGIDWMTGNELSQAVPPAYSEYLGKYMMLAIEAKQVNK